MKSRTDILTSVTEQTERWGWDERLLSFSFFSCMKCCTGRRNPRLWVQISLGPFPGPLPSPSPHRQPWKPGGWGRQETPRRGAVEEEQVNGHQEESCVAPSPPRALPPGSGEGSRRRARPPPPQARGCPDVGSVCAPRAFWGIH